VIIIDMCDDGNEYATQLTYKITIRNAKNTRIAPFVVRVNNKCGRRRRDLKAAIRRAISAFNNAEDRSGYFNLYDSKSLQGHGFPPNLPSNFEGMRMFYHVLWRAFPDSHLVINDLIVEGDKAVSRYTFMGTQEGEFMGIPPSGKRVKVDV
jgi:predicted ester cyclase